MVARLQDLERSFLRHLRAEGRSSATLRLYGQAVTFFTRWLEGQGRAATLDELNRAAVREWLAVLSDTHEPGTVKVRYRGLHRFCSWLVDEDELDTNPMSTLSPPTLKMKPVPLVDDDQLAALLKACGGREFNNRRDEALVRLMLDCGVRVSEACGLRVDQLDLDQGMAIVKGKGAKVRPVYFGARTARALDRYVRMRAAHRWAHLDALFLTQRGALSPDGARERFKVRGAMAGIDDLHPHRLRHTFAHDFLMSGGQERNHRDGAWLADTAQSLGLGTRAIHLRGLHYMVIGQPKPDGKPYTNTDADWCWLQGKAAAAARWLGYLPFDQVIDQRNDAPEIVPFVPPDLWPWVSTELDIDLPDVADLEPSVGISGFTGIQPYRVALVGEKSSLGPVLGPVANRYGADLYLPTGEASSTMVHTLARSGLDGRKVVVLYFHDCDPSGWNMPTSFGRKLQAMQASLYPDIGFEVHRVALTPDQVRAYGLPSTPLKDTEKRADKWLTAMGVQQTEIDALAALQPELLTRLAREAIRPFYDDTLAHRVDAARRDWEAAARAAVREQMAIDDAARAALASQLQAALETVREEVQRVSEQVRVDASQFDLPEPAIPGADIDDDEQPLPLVDSDWSFAEQCRSLIQDKRYGADR